MYSSATKDDTVHNLKNSAQNIRDDARDTTGEVIDDLRATASKAGRKVRNFIDSASNELSHANDTVTAQIRQNPVQSSLIALGIGFVLCALLCR